MRRLILTTLLCGALAAQASDPHRQHGVHHGGADGPVAMQSCCSVIEPARLPDMETITQLAASVRAVAVGEHHDQMGHHLAQLELIERLHQEGVALAIGLEQFQQPYQSWLDRYVAGEISEAEMLRGSEYFDRWRYDYRLYRPILAYAREHAIPLVALNIPAEVNRTVAREGVDALDDQLRAWIPREVDRTVDGYEERLRAIFHHHPNNQQRKFENFLESQLYWDEGMAQRAADYLAQAPGVTMVILAGNGHVMFGSGIPGRLARRLGSPVLTLVNDIPGTLDPDVADFVLLPRKAELMPGGKIGVLLKSEGGGEVVISDFTDGSGGREAGLARNDRLVAIEGEPIASISDVKIVMLDRKPGDAIEVEVERDDLISGKERESYLVTLH